MLSAQLTLDDASGDGNVYELRRYLPDGSERILSTSTASEPTILRIQHTESGQGNKKVHRHLIQSKMTIVEDGVPYDIVVNTTFALPIAIGNAEALACDLYANQADLLTGGGCGDSGLTSTATLLAVMQGQS